MIFTKITSIFAFIALYCSWMIFENSNIFVHGQSTIEAEDPTLIDGASSKLTSQLCPSHDANPNSWPFHTLYTDWLKIFHRYDQFQTYPNKASSALLMDIKETKEFYLLQIDIPGVMKDDIKLNISPNGKELQITVYRKGMELKNEAKEEFKLLERSSGHLTRMIYLPDQADAEKLKAICLASGILEITMPKKAIEEVAKNRFIVID